VAGAVGEVEEQLRRLREVHAFVARFRDGKMSLDEFMTGPDLGLEEDDDELDLDDSFADFLRSMESRLAGPSRRGKKARRRS
jgi:hypothetical protein